MTLLKIFLFQKTFYFSTRFLNRDGNIFNSSRYFVTARRDNLMPSSRNFWKISWSDSGFSIFSALMISSILILTWRLDSSPARNPSEATGDRAGMRFFPQGDEDIRRMLEVIGVGSTTDLFRGIPDHLLVLGVPFG